MKRKDLMPGDWVIWRTKFVQIETVSMNVNPFKIIDGFRKNVMIEDVNPIPFTEQFLEKQGFERAWNSSYYGLRIEKFYICISAYFHTLDIECDDVQVLYLENIQFVHELQHALRLCGLEMEIKL